MEINSIFISKNETELSDLLVFCDLRGIKLTTHSFLIISELTHNITFEYDIIFFSSKNAIEYFLKSNEVKPNCEIAVAGTGTKTYLESLGYYVEFCPTESGDITQSKSEFKNWVENKKVLFPISTISQKSYASVLNSDQYECAEIYGTEIHSRKIEQHDLYIFTSPSNVEGFFQENDLNKSAKIISWGETTSIALKKHGFTPYFELKTSGKKELLDILKSLIEK